MFAAEVEKVLSLNYDGNGELIAAVVAVPTKLCRRNGHVARVGGGTTHLSGVAFTSQGFPDFSPYVPEGGTVTSSQLLMNHYRCSDHGERSRP
jgi:hypothetical protein